MNEPVKNAAPPARLRWILEQYASKHGVAVEDIEVDLWPNGDAVLHCSKKPGLPKWETKAAQRQ